jgi:hypothetical protein
VTDQSRAIQRAFGSNVEASVGFILFSNDLRFSWQRCARGEPFADRSGGGNLESNSLLWAPMLDAILFAGLGHHGVPLEAAHRIPGDRWRPAGIDHVVLTVTDLVSEQIALEVEVGMMTSEDAIALLGTDNQLGARKVQVSLRERQEALTGGASSVVQRAAPEYRTVEGVPISGRRVRGMQRGGRSAASEPFLDAYESAAKCVPVGTFARLVGAMPYHWERAQLRVASVSYAVRRDDALLGALWMIPFATDANWARVVPVLFRRALVEELCRSLATSEVSAGATDEQLVTVLIPVVRFFVLVGRLRTLLVPDEVPVGAQLELASLDTDCGEGTPVLAGSSCVSAAHRYTECRSAVSLVDHVAAVERLLREVNESIAPASSDAAPTSAAALLGALPANVFTSPSPPTGNPVTFIRNLAKAAEKLMMTGE